MQPVGALRGPVRMRATALRVGAAVATLFLVTLAAAAQEVSCTLDAGAGGSYAGLCSEDGIDMGLTLWRPPAANGRGLGHWRGELTVTEDGEEYALDACLDVGTGGTTVHDPRGWFPATRFELVDDRLEVSWDLGRAAAAAPEDVEVLDRALALLSEPSAWHAEDDRECEDDDREGRRSLYCALARASVEVTGEMEHRRPALQEVRFAIDEATGGGLEHRLMDFNNSATFEEVRAVLEAARARVAG